jgi:HSP20 family protein
MKRFNPTDVTFPLLPRFFDDFWTRDWFAPAETENLRPTVPFVNILERKDDFIVEMAAPGFNKKDFNVELNGRLLTIWVDREENAETVEGRYERREFNYLRFRRTFTLPETIKENEINAAYKNGILRIALPKLEPAAVEPHRTIAIS